jgi:hemolysin activation/secretion protein
MNLLLKNRYFNVLTCLLLAGGIAQPVLAEEKTEDNASETAKGVLITSKSNKNKSVATAPLPAPIAPPVPSAVIVTKPEPAPAPEEDVLRFAIRNFTLDGATLLSTQEISLTVAPYIGNSKDFSDVEKALEAIEALYAQKGYSAVHVLLPEQVLEQGDVHFHVIESHFGKISVKNNKLIKFVSEQNALNSLPSVREGNAPMPKQIAKELKLANENPARQLNVVLKAGEKDEEVDATVIVTDAKPDAWNINYDNSGTVETGRSRLGLSYRYANLFDEDHVLTFQTQISPEHTDRVRVFNGSYKIPFYDTGDSAEFSAAYSNINSLVGGLSNFQGGGIIFSSRYNHPLDKIGQFDPRVSFGFDLRDFKPVQQTSLPVTVLYNEIIATPLSVALGTQGKLAGADISLNASAAANLPLLSKGRSTDFEQYDLVNLSNPTPNYRVVRFGGNFLKSLSGDWQIRSTFNGQWSNNLLIQGEQMRLGGQDGVRGFAEGSEGGERGVRGNIEYCTPVYPQWQLNTRALIFYDAGQASTNAGANSAISSYGFGFRSAYSDYITLRMDAGRIAKAGNDPQQQKGDWRVHLGLSANF